ncbi:hypothetical protein RAN53_09630 [Halomonas sp. SSL-5]|uniref:hypothetical protein n=1 Tax=Halomonas sp. SSL-5 TaxID=3065855 RepID=UPI002739A8A6|nr:hypothetical protein [Halomonas sp. SSL-5]MDY7116610.1 hypothetical protein [Halomonas sp. SSL-5]
MANSDRAQQALDKACAATDLEDAIVVGKDANGKVAFYTADVDKERMIALLERARNKLVRLLDD